MANRLKIAFFNYVQKRLSGLGYQLSRSERFNTQTEKKLPSGAESWLSAENPKLRELVSRYLTIKRELTNSSTWSWADQPANPYLLQYFRGDTMFVWQFRGLDNHEIKYALFYYYLLANDKLNLLHRLKDDGLFGNHLFSINNQQISREVLDSVNEINFLERHLKLSQISGLKILDVGSGYGRMAHRLTDAFPNIAEYYCTDAVPYSLFVCDYYTKFRNVKQARMIEMPDIEQQLSSKKIDVAINIHSFSECTLEAIAWWVSQISKAGIRHLMVIPNAGPDRGNRLLTNLREDFQPVIERFGYSLIVKEPKFSDPVVQRYGIFSSHYYLFEKR